MGKHLKRLRAEKSKVKLKQKLLPKGQNITNANFKVKQIRLQSQLPSVESEQFVSSSKKLSLKALITNLQHYNTTSRTNALSGIRDIFRDHPEIVEDPMLKSIVYGVLEMVTDVEVNVRTAAVGLLKEILCKLSVEQKIPFYGVLSVHLACAMTHINTKVQRDSLLFLETVIAHAPDVIKENSRLLIRNYIRLVNNYKHGSHLEVLLTKGSKKDLEKMKLQILSKLFDIFNIVFNQVDELTKQESMEVSYDTMKSFHIKSDQYKHMANLPYLVKKATHVDKDHGSEECEELKTVVELTIPLLLDIWTEFSPKKDNSKLDTNISNSSAQILLIILKIMELIHVRLKQPDEKGKSKEMVWFAKKFSKQFEKQVVYNFPYTANANAKENEVNRSIYVNINMLVCFFHWCFAKPDNWRTNGRVIKYVCDVLLGHESKFIGGKSSLQLISKIIMPQSSHKKRNNTVLSATVSAYYATTSEHVRQGLLHVLAAVAKYNLQGVETNQEFLRWMSDLPLLLSQPVVSVDVILVVNSLVQQKQQTLLTNLDAHACSIAAALPQLTVEGVNADNGKHLIANILYSCHETTVAQVLQQIESDILYPADLKLYMTNTLSYRCNTN